MQNLANLGEMLRCSTWHPKTLVEGKPSRVTGADPVARSHDEEGAEDLAVRALSAVGLPLDT